MDDLIIRAIELLVVVIAAIIGRYLIPILKTKIGTEKFGLILEWAKVFVTAAEKIWDEKGMGEKKREAVLELIVTKAKEIGLELTTDQVRAILESALAELKKDGVIVDE